MHWDYKKNQQQEHQKLHTKKKKKKNLQCRKKNYGANSINQL